jgi:hypothetical protein
MKRLFIVWLMTVGLANASSIDPTTITQVLVGPNFGNKVFVVLSKKPSDIPTCQTNTRYSYVFDGTTPTGQMTLSVVLAAYATQSDVWLGGSGSCSLYSNVENLDHIVTK